MTAHLRMNAIYWGLTALCIMDHKDALDRDEMIEFVMSCWDDEAGRWWLKYWLGSNRFATTGAFGAHPDHDAHLLSTLSAIQILVTHDALDRLDIPRVVKCMWETDNLQPIAFLTAPHFAQSFSLCNSPQGYSQEIHLERQIRDFCTAQ